MSSSASPIPSRLGPIDADRIGIAASVLCAIHCGLAPFLLLFLPAFGRVWAHPASHALVAIFIVPLAAFSIYKGYQTHRKRWIAGATILGILFVLGGAALPAFTEEGNAASSQFKETTATLNEGDSAIEETTTECSDGCSSKNTMTDQEAGETACVDQCCPSLQIDDSGEMSLHIPPAAIVTTLGGVFLIIAHIGNLFFSVRACRAEACEVCA